MTMSTKHRVADGLGTSLIALSAAFGLLLGVRAVVAVELPAIRSLLGLQQLAREDLGLSWSPYAAWPAQFQADALERMMGMVAAVFLAALAVSVLNALVVLVEAGAARRQELATRLALGAPPVDVARMLLGPVRRVVTTAAALGLVLGLVSGGALRATWPDLLEAPRVLSAAGELALPLLVMTLAAAYAYAALGLHLGFRGALASSLGHGGRVSEDRGSVALRRLLAAVQMGAAGSVVISGLLLASGLTAERDATNDAALTTVMGVVLPEQAEPVVTEAGVQSTGDATEAGGAPSGWAAALATLTEVPGIEAGSLATRGTLGGVGLRDYVTAECGACFKGGLPVPFWSAYADHYAVAPSFFELAGFQPAEGRLFDVDDDMAGARVAVVNRTFANVAFENGEPLGHVIRVGRGMDDWYTVVGVVEDYASVSLGGRDQPGSAVYLSLLQHPTQSAVAIVRGSADAVADARVRLTEAGVATDDPQTLAGHLTTARAPQRWAAMVAAALSLLILMMAGLGTHALSLQVARRRGHELAIRQVMGASPRRLLRHVLLRSGRIGLWGTAVMLFFGSLGVALLKKAFGGLPTPGPLPYLAVGTLLTAVSMVASWDAARAATRIPPSEALE